MSKTLQEWADEALQVHPGNLIEIGCGYGTTTGQLCQIAEKHQVQVFAIDPFDSAPEVDPSYNSYPYERFLQNVTGWIEQGILVHYRVSSALPSLYDTLIKYEPFAFAFVDGVQTKDFVLSDLALMNRLGVERICVDDYGRLTEISQVPPAVDQFLTESKYWKNATAAHLGRQVVVLDRS